jgi:sulfatase modifying factor 1
MAIALAVATGCNAASPMDAPTGPGVPDSVAEELLADGGADRAAPSDEATRSGADADAAIDGPTSCPAGMVLVEGDYCPTLVHRCMRFLEGPVQDRCAEYAKTATCYGKPRHERYCIDEYEYPNLPGVKPAVMVDWFDAKAACEAEGKRLCTSSEWTLACEGPERLPYPYGYKRDEKACNIDRQLPDPDERAFSYPRKIGLEVARLDQRVASGEMQSCVSPYGVHDMTGNVDEWVVNEKHFEPVPADDPDASAPRISGLKGGYWGPVRDRCRPMTTFHNEWFRYYQVGFRCCASAP